MGLEQSPAPQAAACRVSDSGTATQLEAQLGQGQCLFPLVLFEDLSLTVGTWPYEV